ncbi:MAG: M56 family metallopeptidase, partial [Tepidisphaeraceae bacterium]
VPVMEGTSQTRAVAPIAPPFAVIAEEVQIPSPSPAPAAANVTAGVVDASATPPDPLPQPAVHVAVLAISPSVDWRYVVLGTWMGGSLVFLLIAAVRVWRFGRTLRGARDVDASLRREIEEISSQLGLARPPRACVVSAALSPMLWFLGVGQAWLVLPAGLLETMSAAQRAGVIAHELAHLRRRDHWVRLFELPVTVALWWHPLVWVARRGLREAEEQCCDAWAVSVLPAGRRSYADALISAMESIARPIRLPLGATGLGRLATLRRRLAMIIAQPPPKSLSHTGRLAVVALLGIVAIIPVRGQAPEKPAGAESTGPSITVAPGASLQKAIDKAPDGATITLGEGFYPESITITKPITLAGAGWDKTIIGPEKAGTLSQQQKDEFFKKLEATTDPEERARIAMELAAGTQPPTIMVKRVAGVTIAGLRVRGAPTGSPDRLTGETLILFDGASACVLRECAIVGPASNGVSIVNGSDVRIERSLVAAIWNVGVRVYAGDRGMADAKPAKVHLVNTDVRNCYHRCVTITGEGSVVERCRISGSAWHGVRYDNCSPTIKDNQIFANARSGIYASGKTLARVTGNVFWRNEMDAMSCWFNNADVVEGNTIVGNCEHAQAGSERERVLGQSGGLPDPRKASAASGGQREGGAGVRFGRSARLRAGAGFTRAQARRRRGRSDPVRQPVPDPAAGDGDGAGHGYARLRPVEETRRVGETR